MDLRSKLRKVSRKAGNSASSPDRPNLSKKTSGLFGVASSNIANRTRLFHRNASRVASGTVSGAIRAADEISGEATFFVRDAVIGVVEGTGRVARFSRPVIREVVSAAILSSSQRGDNIRKASRQAVEGAVVGNAKAGFGADRAAVQASEGVVEAVQNLGIDFTDVVSPAIHGVITGVLATSGNLFEATQHTAYSLVRNGVKSKQDAAEVATIIATEAIRASRIYNVETTDAVMGAARGCIEAAYDIDRPTGDSVRNALLTLIDAPLNMLAPPIRRSVLEAISDLTDDLRERPQAWRGVALWKAGTQLVRIGGIDSGAALAYYTLLAFFPLTALTVLGFSIFLDPGIVRSLVTEVSTYYFPGADEFLFSTLEYLYAAKLLVSLIAFAGILLGSLGLFVAANRGVNRVFDRPPKRLFRTTVSTTVVIFLSILLFLISIGFTAVFQAALALSERLPTYGAPLNFYLLATTSVISAVVPLLISGLVFVLVYKHFPNQPIQWSDATFGGILTVIIFEVAKYVFFWLASLVSHRELLYGPISSVVLMLIWSHVAGMIFLYGAALTKQASDLRPREISRRAAISVSLEREALRQANIELGRSAWRDSENGWDPEDERW